MESPDLFQSNLALIDRVLALVCTKNRLFGADAEDFASEARLALLADDCAILRQWEGRSSLSTYLSVVVQRLFADARMHLRGRWFPSAEARRLGEAAVRLETLVVRDGRSLEEALPHLKAVDPLLDRPALAAMLDRLPYRTPRPRPVELEKAVDVASTHETADAAAIAADGRRLSERTGRIMREALAALSLQDRMIVRLRFTAGMSIADVSRVLRLPQRPLYRRIEGILRTLRAALHGAGIDVAGVEQLIGSPVHEMDFGFAHEENGQIDQSKETGTVAETGPQP